jgi:hypothetical protein
VFMPPPQDFELGVDQVLTTLKMPMAACTAIGITGSLS